VAYNGAVSAPAPLRIAPIFAAPFASAVPAGAAELNAELAPLLIARATEAWRDPAAPLDPGRFESRPDLFQWPEPAVARLREMLLEHVGRVAAELSGFGAAEAAALRLQAKAWFGLVRPGGAVPARQHAMASWCALYCVQSTDAPAERLDAGSLRLYDPRLGNAYLDAGNGRLRMPYGHGHFGARQSPGQLSIFPAHLLHEIAPLPESCTRPLVYVGATFRFALAEGA
jgi:hypothetical protein